MNDERYLDSDQDLRRYYQDLYLLSSHSTTDTNSIELESGPGTGTHVMCCYCIGGAASIIALAVKNGTVSRCGRGLLLSDVESIESSESNTSLYVTSTATAPGVYSKYTCTSCSLVPAFFKRLKLLPFSVPKQCAVAIPGPVPFACWLSNPHPPRRIPTVHRYLRY